MGPNPGLPFPAEEKRDREQAWSSSGSLPLLVFTASPSLVLSSVMSLDQVGD